MSDKIGHVEPVKVDRTLHQVRVYTDDDANERVTIYFETREAAERFYVRLPEATR